MAVSTAVLPGGQAAPYTPPQYVPAGKGAGAAGGTTVHVDFDGKKGQQQFAGPRDTLKTAGLANCIPVVTYDKRGRGAVMRHFDTSKAMDPWDPKTGKVTAAWDASKFDDVRDETIAHLQAQVGKDADVGHSISFGSVWAKVPASDKKLWERYRDLVHTVRQSFGVGPTMAGPEARWHVGTLSWAQDDPDDKKKQESSSAKKPATAGANAAAASSAAGAPWP